MTVPLKKPQSREKLLVSANELEVSLKVKKDSWFSLPSYNGCEVQEHSESLTFLLLSVLGSTVCEKRNFMGVKMKCLPINGVHLLPLSFILSGPSLAIGPFLSKLQTMGVPGYHITKSPQDSSPGKSCIGTLISIQENQRERDNYPLQLSSDHRLIRSQDFFAPIGLCGINRVILLTDCNKEV